MHLRKHSLATYGHADIVHGIAKNKPTRHDTMNIIGISGSPTAVSRSDWLLHHFLDSHAARREALTVLDTVRVRELPAQPLLHADLGDAALAEALARVARADIVVIATPIYKAAYSGLLKTFLDLLPQDGLRGKAILALATGGSPAHLLAVDYALKPVLSALGVREIVDTVYATDVQLPRATGHTPYISTAEVDERLARAAGHLHGRLPLGGAAPVAPLPATARGAVLHTRRGIPLPEGVRISA